MPLIDISLKDLNEIVGKKLGAEDLEKFSDKMKIGIEKLEGDSITIEIKDSNRPDLLSVEGIAREMKGIMGKEIGLKKYKINDSDFLVKKAWAGVKVRPNIVCAVVKNVKLSDHGIKQIIQLQEKLCEGFGRKRKEVAIGIYDFDKIAWPVSYTSTKPEGLRFIPLDMDVALTPKEILEQHEKGKEYAHLLAGAKDYPILMDKMNNVLSMPPIINSNYSGKVTEATKNLFVEVTGFSKERIIFALNIVLAALADRGGEIYKVRVGKESYPDFSYKKKRFSFDDVKDILGIDLKPKEIVRLLEKARYSAEIVGRSRMIEATVPFYRADILHPVDIIEDIAIAYGYNNIKTEEPKVYSEGSLLKSTKLSNKIASIMTSIGFQEVAGFVMSNKEDQFKKMGVPVEEVIEIENPVSQTYSCLRKWLLPSLMNVFSQSKASQYPQKIFETGEICMPDEKAETRSVNVQKLAVAICGEAGFTEIKQVLDYISRRMKLGYALNSSEHPSFIEGRFGDIILDGKKIGFIGEISPKVIAAWGLEMPVAALEIDLSEL